MVDVTEKVRAMFAPGNRDRPIIITFAQLAALEHAQRWAMGDLINEAKDTHGPMKAYKFAAEAMGKQIRWAQELAYVAATFPPETRRASVSWNIYRVCTKAEDPIRVLEDAVRRRLTASQIRELSRRRNGDGGDDVDEPEGVDQEFDLYSGY